jgi:gliding motility-associated-like protein
MFTFKCYYFAEFITQRFVILSMLKLWLLVFSLMLFQLGYSLEKGPEIIRICLDNSNSAANLYWQTMNDVCNSFKRIDIYASKDGGPWQKVASVNSLLDNTKSIPLSDINAKYEFKLITYSACNGNDSFISNIQSIDDNRPSDIEIDSLSFDMSSQRLSVGWSKNPSKDTKGYRVYSYISPVSNKIIDTENTSIILGNYTVSNPSEITMATFDSCDLFGGISLPQSAAYLSGQIDTCSRSIQLQWQPYRGWSSINQYLIINKNGTGFTIASSLLSSDKALKLSNISLGDHLCYYIRTENKNTLKTSSSNTVCFKTRAFSVPKLNYLSNSTVTNKQVDVTYITDNLTDIDSIVLEKSEGNHLFKYFIGLKRTSNNPQFNFTDQNVDVNGAYYSYRVKTFNKCRETNPISNIGTSIYLSKPVFLEDKYSFSWNPYAEWEHGIDYQDIEISNNRFTWNTYKKETAGASRFEFLSEEITNDSVCFRIKANEKTNSQGLASVSLSNIQCVQTITDFYFPEVINPFSENNILKVYGKGLDPSRGSIEIFNRWGQKIFETKQVTIGWNGTSNGEFVDMGNYIYKATFYDQRNNSYFRAGTVLILR